MGNPVVTVLGVAYCPSDVHGNGDCPHTVTGLVKEGAASVFFGGQRAAVVGSKGVHFGMTCCGPNTFEVVEGSSAVFVENLPVAFVGATTRHCGGTGVLITGLANVLVGGRPLALGRDLLTGEGPFSELVPPTTHVDQGDQNGPCGLDVHVHPVAPELHRGSPYQIFPSNLSIDDLVNPKADVEVTHCDDHVVGTRVEGTDAASRGVGSALRSTMKKAGTRLLGRQVKSRAVQTPMSKAVDETQGEPKTEAERRREDEP